MTLRRNIIHIPLMGSSGIYPSGPLEFDQDWPGLWIRGDDCLYLRIELQSLKAKCKKQKIYFPDFLDEIMECIEEGVKVKGNKTT